jgi:hypothetical protein
VTTPRSSTRPLAAAALAGLVALSGCALQTKKEQTALITHASDRTMRLAPHDATLTSSIRPHDVNGRHITKVSIKGHTVPVPSRELPKAAVALDLRIKRAVVLPSPLATSAPVSQAEGAPSQATGPATPPSTEPTSGQTDGAGVPAGLTTAASLASGSLRRVPLAVGFSNWDIFVRPNATTVAQGSGVQAGSSAWLWLDVGALDPDRKTSLAAPTPVLLLAPHVLVRLLKGALTGSVRRLGAENVGGVATTHFRFNIDRDKAAAGLRDADATRWKRLFEADNIDGTFYNGAEAWIDRTGVVRRMAVTVPQRIDALTSFDLTYRLEIGAPRTDPLPFPSNDDLAEVPTLPELLPGGGS